MPRRSTAATGLFLLVALALFGQAPSPRDVLAGDRVVVVASGLPDEEFLVCSAAVAAVNPEAQLLRDSNKLTAANKRFLSAYKPGAVVPIGTAKSLPILKKHLGDGTTSPLLWERGPDDAAGKVFFPTADNVVVAPADNRRLLLQAVCLAGVLRAPLVLLRGEEGEKVQFQQRVTSWQAKTVYGVGSAAGAVPEMANVRLVALADEEVVVRTYRQLLRPEGKVHTVVVANPADLVRGQGKMSSLAPWIALKKRAVLVLTNEEGTNTAAAVRAAADKLKFQPEALLIAATLKAIPTERRPNPVKGKDVDIEMEPLTPEGETPFSFATGRLFHKNPGVVLLQLARGRLLEGKKTRYAMVVSNPGGGLPLLETFSRHTALELRNAGYHTTAWFGEKVSKGAMRHALPNQDIFLWEGHYRTLIDEFKFLTWDEPLPPSLYFMQSCLALKEEEAGPLVRRGALAVVGASTRTYSATGGAFTLAFFNALLYDDQSLGGALRQAKNFLLTYSLLKEKRLGEKAKLKGVNVRSSWAFTLWGDPTLHLPHPSPPADRRDSVRTELEGERLTISLPERAYEKVNVGKYEARMLPNARLAGLLKLDAEDEESRTLVPFVFAEVLLPRVPTGVTPVLTSRIPERNWVFAWDPRRKAGYVLVTPRAKDEETLRFKVDWE